MTDSVLTSRERIRRIIAEDLRPIHPLWSPSRRVLVLLPMALFLAVFAGVKYGRRDDFDQLGMIVTWGLSGVQWMLGVVVLGFALRHAVPGYGVSRRGVFFLSLSAIGFIVGVTAITYAIHPTFVPAAKTLRFWSLCLVGPLEFGVPLLLVASVLAARAFPTRPAAVGALCGLAAGVVADSGWRLTCWITAPSHVLGAHALAVAIMVLAGAILGTVVDRIRQTLLV